MARVHQHYVRELYPLTVGSPHRRRHTPRGSWRGHMLRMDACHRISAKVRGLSQSDDLVKGAQGHLLTFFFALTGGLNINASLT